MSMVDFFCHTVSNGVNLILDFTETDFLICKTEIVIVFQVEGGCESIFVKHVNNVWHMVNSTKV